MDSRRICSWFLTLSETAEFLYKVTNYYSPEHEQCIVWDDADIGIDWVYEGVTGSYRDFGAGKLVK